MGTSVATIEQAEKALIDPIATQIASALPETITPGQFRSAFVVAIQKNPDLLKCDLDSLRNALIDCASDGLLPNNKQAALVPFKSKDKPQKQVQYMPMVQGIISKMHEFGEAYELVVACVHEKDDIDFTENDTRVEAFHHKRPQPMTAERGAIIGAYVFFLDKDRRTVHREIMDRTEIDQARAISKGGSVWEKWLSEMCKKTVIRRGSKYVPLSNKMKQIIERGDELVSFKDAAKNVPEGYNPMLGDNGTETIIGPMLPDLLPGVFAEYARALYDAHDAPSMKKIVAKFTEQNKVFFEKDATDKDLERIESIFKLHVARCQFKITPEELGLRIREVVGFDPDYKPAEEPAEGDQPAGEGDEGDKDQAGTESKGGDQPEEAKGDNQQAQKNSDQKKDNGNKGKKADDALPKNDVPEHPESDAEYRVYADDRVNAARNGKISADALQAWWNSGAEKKLRNGCNVDPEWRDSFKVTVDQVAKDIREGKIKPDANED